MKILFKNLIIQDFKGISSESFSFNDDICRIVGDNATGKTTILDSLYWVFYGKDSNGKKKFDIYPLDKNNKKIKNTTPKVELKITIDGEELILTREIIKNTTECYINGINLKIKDYDKFISDNIVDEKLFMTLINPVFFGTNYKWSEQKKIVQEKISVEDTILVKDEYSLIRDEINTYGIDNIKEKYSSIIKKLSKSKSQNEGAENYLMKKLENKSIDEDKEQLIKERNLLSGEINVLEQAYDVINIEKNKMFKMENNINDKKNKHKNEIQNINRNIDMLNDEKTRLLNEYKEISLKLNNIDDKCSLCGSTLNKDEILRQKNIYANRIKEVKNKGIAVNNKIDILKKGLECFKIKDIISQEEQQELKSLQEKIKVLSNNIESDKITLLRKKYNELNILINEYDNIKKEKSELEEIRKKINKDTSDLDDMELKLEKVKRYHREYSQLLADNLNSKLEKIQIKTFETLKNGEIKDTFIITMNGVPYNMLNSAAKIEAGIELIKLLKESLGINFPIIVDNKESITKEFDIDNQLITLSVKKGYALHVQN